MQCPKKVYYSRAQAKKTLKWLNKTHYFDTKINSIYWCDSCSGYHVTTNVRTHIGEDGFIYISATGKLYGYQFPEMRKKLNLMKKKPTMAPLQVVEITSQLPVTKLSHIADTSRKLKLLLRLLRMPASHSQTI